MVVTNISEGFVMLYTSSLLNLATKGNLPYVTSNSLGSAVPSTPSLSHL